MKFLAGLQGILDQCSNGHRADATWNRSNEGRTFACGFEVYVADYFTTFQAVDADIDHDRTRFDPISWDKPRFAHGNDQRYRHFRRGDADF